MNRATSILLCATAVLAAGVWIKPAEAAVGTLADSNGHIAGWGWNSYGQTNVPASNDFVAIAAGADHGLAMKTDGSLVGWGRNDFGQATAPAGNDFVAIAAGDFHNLGLKSDGSLAGWGYNTFGQATVPAGNDFVAIAAGNDYSLALKSDGSLVAWGRNLEGQTNVPAGNNFKAIAAGGGFGLAQKSDGSLVGWGNNLGGPTIVPAGNDFVAFAAGEYNGLALKSDSSLVGWGSNNEGQINVPAGNDFAAIAPGWYNGLALKSDGSLAAWGVNFYGETNVPAGNNFVAIAGGQYHGLALNSRTEYDGDLLISGSGVFANLNRSITVAGNATIQTTTSLYNNPLASIAGKVVLSSNAVISGGGSINSNGLAVLANSQMNGSLTYTNTGALTGVGGLTLNGTHLTTALTAASSYVGALAIQSGWLAFNGTGVLTPSSLTLSNGGELRQAAGQRVLVGDTGSNAGKIELLGNPASGGASEIEFLGAATNSAATGLITGHDAVMRFTGGLNNLGAVSLTRGANDVSGDITNNAGGSIFVTGGAAATFYDDIIQNGTFKVSKVGSTTSTAVILGSFSGSGGSTGGGDIFFEGDLRPGNSPATVTFGNNVGFSWGSALKIELGGTTAGSQYDQIHVTGQLALDGTLNVSLVNGFNPQSGRSFDILDWGSLAGTFAAVELPALAGGLQWNTSQLYTAGVLSVGLPGDYNANGAVDAADYVVWRKGLGTTYTQNDYNVWRSNFGDTAGSGAASNAAVPEPGSWALVGIAFVGALVRHRRIGA